MSSCHHSVLFALSFFCLFVPRSIYPVPHVPRSITMFHRHVPSPCSMFHVPLIFPVPTSFPHAMPPPRRSERHVTSRFLVIPPPPRLCRPDHESAVQCSAARCSAAQGTGTGTGNWKDRPNPRWFPRFPFPFFYLGFLSLVEFMSLVYFVPKK